MSTTVKSVKWSVLEKVLMQSIQLILSIIIARQLLPSDYGIVAMLSVFMAVAQTFIDSGFSQALIQKKDRTNVDYSTVFFFNIGIGVVLYLIFVLCSPLIASFYNEPILKPIIAVVGLNFIISSFATVQRAIISIKLEFKKLAFISLVSVVVSGGLGLYMAYNGYGVWTLVAQNLVFNACSTLLIWITTKWHPKRVFSKQSFYELFSFGSKLLASNIIHTIYKNLYNIIIGKVFLSSELGFFNRAQTLTSYPSSIFTSTIARAVYPIECQMQDDKERLANSFLTYITMTSMLVFPLMLGIAAISEPLVFVLLTEKWMPCVPLMQILACACMFDPIMGMSADLLSVLHRSDYYLKAEIIKKIVAITILVISIFLGVKAMCFGLIIYSICDMVIVFYFIRKLLPAVNYYSVFKSLIPVLVSSLMMFFAVYFMATLLSNTLFNLIICIVVGALSYLMAGIIIMPKRIKEFILLAKKII